MASPETSDMPCARRGVVEGLDVEIREVAKGRKSAQRRERSLFQLVP
jgi:hypothetical protein